MLVWLFEDKRATVACMYTWLAVVVVCCYKMGVSDNKFLQFGPTQTTVVLGFVVDTWTKWTMVTAFSFVNTCVNAFIANSLDPWIVNTVQDTKTPTIPYSKLTCIIIVQMYSIYCHVMSLVGLSLLFSQVDILLVRMVAEVIVSSFALTRFLKDKTVGRPEYEHVPEGPSAAATEREL